MVFYDAYAKEKKLTLENPYHSILTCYNQFEFFGASLMVLLSLLTSSGAHLIFHSYLNQT